MGIPVEGGKTRDPRQKRSEGVGDDTQPGVFHAAYLLLFCVGSQFFSILRANRFLDMMHLVYSLIALFLPSSEGLQPVKKLTVM